MKCYTCEREIDVTASNDWYGAYNCDKLVRIICNECIKDKTKKEQYKKGVKNE